jgi:uncharacterized protein YggU (UPF0235/DUF167 family)
MSSKSAAAVLHVSVKPNARSDSLARADGGGVEIRTMEAPREGAYTLGPHNILSDSVLPRSAGSQKLHFLTASAGAANEDVVKQVAKFLSVPKSSVEVTAGHKSRDKRVHIKGMTQPAMDARVAALAGHE